MQCCPFMLRAINESISPVPIYSLAWECTIRTHNPPPWSSLLLVLFWNDLKKKEPFLQFTFFLYSLYSDGPPLPLPLSSCQPWAWKRCLLSDRQQVQSCTAKTVGRGMCINYKAKLWCHVNLSGALKAWTSGFNLGGKKKKLNGAAITLLQSRDFDHKTFPYPWAQSYSKPVAKASFIA